MKRNAEVGLFTKPSMNSSWPFSLVRNGLKIKERAKGFDFEKN
jgi:hypothetical protein